MPARRIALVGVGRWGRNILRDLVSLGCEVVGVAANEQSHAAARDGGATDVVAEIGDVGAIDGAVIATPVRTHEQVTREALGFGVPVFVEKPLTADAAAAARLAEEGDGRLFVMDKWRYHPGVLALARIAANGELGDVVGLRTQRVGWGNTHRGDVDDIWVLAPHDLAIAQEILGRVPEPQAAVGQTDGTMAHLTGLLGHRPWFEMHVGGSSVEHCRTVDLICTGGVAWLSARDGRLDRRRARRGCRF